MPPGIKSRYVPHQHGAWAMLLVPFIFGMIAGRPVALHGLLFIVWLLSYLFTYPLLQWIRTRKLEPYLRPMLIYGCLFAVSGTALAVTAPQLLKWIPLFIPLFLVNCRYARINRERAFVNDLAAVLLFSLIVFVAHDVGGAENRAAVTELFAYSILYFVGTVFYVKTNIRERRNPNFYRYSAAYHLIAAVAGAVLYSPPMAAMLGVLLVRAVLVPRLNVSVKQIGIMELVYSLLIVAAAVWTYG